MEKRRKQSEASLRPVILTCRLFAVAPFALKKAECKFSPGFATYSLIVATTIGGLTVLGAANDLYEDDDKAIRMVGTATIYVTCLDFSGIVFSNIVNAFSMVVQYGQFLGILAHINKIDKILAENREKFSYVKKICVTLAVASTLLIVDGVFWYVNTKDRARKYGMLKFAPFYVSYLFLVVFVLQYWIICDVIRRRAVHLRKEVELAKRELYGKDVADNMGGFITAYQHLDQAVRCTNSTYSLPIAAAFFNMLLHIVVALYYWLNEIFFQQRLNNIVILTLWIVAYVLVLFLTVQSPEAVSIEISLIAGIVAEMLSFEVVRELREKLNIFCANLTHRPIKFSASGLFDIDRRIVTSMASVITTYIVILMQFSINKNT